jgi:hypothetical protein
MTEATGSFKTLIPIYQITWHHIHGYCQEIFLGVVGAESLPTDLWSGHLRYFYDLSIVVELCIEI